MKKCKGFIFTFVFAAMLLCFLPVLRANAGWENTDAGKKYLISSSKGYAKGLRKINGQKYYFDSDGVMKTGFVTVNGHLYYFGSDGAAKTGWITVDGKKYYGKTTGKTFGRLYVSRWHDNYYFQSDGSLAVSTWVGNKWVDQNGKYNGKRKTGFVTLEGNTYYYTTTSKYATGWFSVKGKYYYADSKGVVQKKKWIGKCYVNAKGVRVTGMKTIGSKTYIFDSNGQKYTKQWVKYKNNYYYVGAAGHVKKSTWVKKKYYVNADGVRVTGWQTIDGKTYYFSSKGVRQTGLQKISGKKYYFDSTGAMLTSGWVSDIYYAGSDGALVTGLQELDGEIYYFNKNTAKKVTKKLKTVGSNKYYFLPTSGQAVRSMRVYYGSSFYYFDENGKMVTNKWVNQYYYGSDGKQEKYRTGDGWWKADNNSDTYYYKNGTAVTGLQTIDGERYYFGDGGVMQTGIQTVGGKKYYFGTDGKMVTSTAIIIGSTEYTIDSSGVVIEEESVAVSGNSKGAQIANFAIKYVGNPYVYGGTSLTNGADCSGFVQTVFANFGYKLLRTADEQMKGPSASQIKSAYTEGVSVTVSKDSLQPGDLLFYGTSSYASHVAIYIGNGQIVHASNSQAYPAGGIKISNWNYQTPVKAMRYWS